MNRRIVVSPQADGDLTAQVDYYLNADLPDVAIRLEAAAQETYDRLAIHPHAGVRFRTSPPEAGEVRTWGVRGFRHHRIFYAVGPDRIEILRLRHTARDPNTLDL